MSGVQRSAERPAERPTHTPQPQVHTAADLEGKDKEKGCVSLGGCLTKRHASESLKLLTVFDKSPGRTFEVETGHLAAGLRIKRH